jgi:cobyrinic acid a,c-diamide synthase
MKGFVISAPMTGSGKTTITLGLLAALRNRGIATQPFKVGPDFIDPGLHHIASGVPSHNLDGWMVPRQVNESLFAAAGAGNEVAVVEGVMGLFDGFDGLSETGSTAQMAKWLGLPVILVVDAHGMARSAAALVQGFRSFDPDLKIAGVIFNRVASERHYRILADAVKDVPSLGWLPKNPAIEIPERHLGLLTGKEELPLSRIKTLGKFIAQHVNVDMVLAVAGFVPKHLSGSVVDNGADSRTAAVFRTPVALAHDRAFSFYYHANRRAMEQAGAEIVEFSPLTDPEVPNADFLYIGGGYPELYRRELEANASMRSSIKRFIESGKKFYAECGGLMYLARSIEDSEMVGILENKIEMTEKLVDFGYCEVTTRVNSILGPAGTTARGHQFHYSRMPGPSGDLYAVNQSGRQYAEGFAFSNGIASYIHLHFLSNPAIVRNMLNS